MTDLERFFRRLVANLAGSDPALLHRPIPLEDIHQSIVPYRSNRRALHLESSEDYELVLLRLCAGEGALVRTEPEEARARFEEELRSPNPDLGVLHRVEHVVVSLRSEPLARALRPEADPELAYAPRRRCRRSSPGSIPPWTRRSTWPSTRISPTSSRSPSPSRAHGGASGAAVPVLRRQSPGRSSGALLSPLRPAPVAAGVPAMPPRGRARLAPLRELRSRAGRALSRAPLQPHAPRADTPLR